MELRLFPDMMIPSYLVLQRLVLCFSCKVISGGIDVSCLLPNIKRVESFKVVGVPVGEFFEQIKQKVFRLINIIKLFLQGHADHTFHLLRSCINTWVELLLCQINLKGLPLITRKR